VGKTIVTALALARRPAKAKQAAESGPVVITRRGAPTHVLMTFADYERLRARGMSLAEALADPADLDFDFDPPRLGREIFRPVDFDEDLD
jgi:prevent-host-death family protein